MGINLLKLLCMLSSLLLSVVGHISVFLLVGTRYHEGLLLKY